MNLFDRERTINIVAACLLLIAVQTIVFAEYFDVLNRKENSFQNHIACTQEAKLCPDGSYVGRTGPNCEFAECAKTVIAQIDTSDWKTYRNEEYGFEAKHPSSWAVNEFSEYIGFRDPLWDKNKISGDTITITIFKEMTEQQALHEAGFQTRSEADPNDFFSGKIPEGEYFTPGSSAGQGSVAIEKKINGLRALVADVPIRLYGGEEDEYIGAGWGIEVFLFGNNVYARVYITYYYGNSDEISNQILSTFKFIQEDNQTQNNKCDFQKYRGKGDFSGCEDGYQCFVGTSQPCGPGDDCSRLDAVGDNLCYKVCASNADCSGKSHCENKEAFLGDVQVKYTICIQ